RSSRVRRIADESISYPRLIEQISGPGRIDLDLLAELPHQHPEVLRLVHAARAPDRPENGAMRQDTVGMLREEGQQPEVFGRELNVFVASEHTVAIAFDSQIARVQTLRRLR